MTHEYDWDACIEELDKRRRQDPLLDAFSDWLESYDYDSWKEAVMPEDELDGMFMWDYADDLREELDKRNLLK